MRRWNLSLLKRFERDEEADNEQNHKLCELYFMMHDDNNDNIDNDEIIKNIICQQMLDTIHCDLNPSMHITQKDIDTMK